MAGVHICNFNEDTPFLLLRGRSRGLVLARHDDISSMTVQGARWFRFSLQVDGTIDGGDRSSGVLRVFEFLYFKAQRFAIVRNSRIVLRTRLPVPPIGFAGHIVASH